MGGKVTKYPDDRRSPEYQEERNGEVNGGDCIASLDTPHSTPGTSGRTIHKGTSWLNCRKGGDTEGRTTGKRTHSPSSKRTSTRIASASNVTNNGHQTVMHDDETRGTHPRPVLLAESVPLIHSGVKVLSLKTDVDNRPTVIDERSSYVLKYRTPHFRAFASVEIPPLELHEHVQVGWVQVCTSMVFINKYGEEGITSWEFPELVMGKYRMVSDADGKQYPWYGTKQELRAAHGPTTGPTILDVRMDDNFFPQVTWCIPKFVYSPEPRLTYIYRKQKFFTYLVARDVLKDSFQTLKTISWSMELAIDIVPSNPLGSRATLLGPVQQETPRVINNNTPGARLDMCAMEQPNANNSQVLVWRPMSGEPRVIVPPFDTTVNLQRYLALTRDHCHTLLRCVVSARMQHGAARLRRMLPTTIQKPFHRHAARHAGKIN